MKAGNPPKKRSGRFSTAPAGRPPAATANRWEFIVVRDPRRALDELIHCESYDGGRYRDDEAIARFIRTLTLQGAYGRRGTGD
jgi:hypothetical protein